MRVATTIAPPTAIPAIAPVPILPEFDDLFEDDDGGDDGSALDEDAIDEEVVKELPFDVTVTEAV